MFIQATLISDVGLQRHKTMSAPMSAIGGNKRTRSTQFELLHMTNPPDMAPMTGLG
jgi:hypothetical protein